MPKNPNTKHTGFYWFMQEILPELRQQGRAFPNGLSDVVPVARPFWKELDPERKAKFDNMAKEMKRRDREAALSNTTSRGSDDRLDNIGHRIAFRVDGDKEMDNKRIADRNCAVRNWPETIEEMKEMKFYFISFQHLLKLDEDYIPIEIGMVEWSMLHGIHREFHNFIDPAGIPMGYRYKCTQHMDETHMIPIEGFDKAVKDYRGLWNRIVNFISPTNYELPSIYCTSVEYPEVVSQLDWIFSYACIKERNPISRIFILEDLVQDLSSRTVCGETLSLGSCTDILTTSIFDFEPNTKCEFHAEQENRNCALGTVKRYAFTLADQFSQESMFDFLLTDKHLPLHSDDRSVVTVLQPSYPAARAETTANMTTPRRNDDHTTFATPDIRYRPDVDQLVIKLDDSDEDSDDQSQFSYSAHQRKKELLNVDRYHAPSQTWNVAASSRPDIADEEEFPTLGGGGMGGRSKFSPAARVQPPASKQKWQDDTSSAYSGWQPSAAYLEKKRDEELERASQPSLYNVMRVSEKTTKQQPPITQKPLGRGRGLSYSDIRNSCKPHPESDASSGSSRGLGQSHNSVQSVPGGLAQSHTSSKGASSRPSATTNPWAGGAKRAPPGSSSRGRGMGMIGIGRGKGTWNPSQPEPGRPGRKTETTPVSLLATDDNFRVTPVSPLASADGVHVTSEQRSPYRINDAMSSGDSVTSDMQSLSVTADNPPDVTVKRPPPGFGRGILRGGAFR